MRTALLTRLLFLSVLQHLCSALSLTCLEYPYPHNPRISIQVDCSPLQTQPQAQKAAAALPSASSRSSGARSSALASATISLISQASLAPIADGLRSPVSSILQEPALPAPVANQDATNRFVFDISCPASYGAANCADANATLYLAGGLISNILQLSAPILVNATLTSFCSTLGICDEGGTITSLAAASPARNIPLVDDDGIVRYYPQAVVKQMASYFPQQPQLGAYDINLNVNAQASFYFSGRAAGRPAPAAIKSTQTDFFFVVMHELMHGLGFTSSYEDYFHPSSPSTVTPNVRIFVTESNGKQGLEFAGFSEYAFDRFVQVNGTLLTGSTVANMNTRLFAETSGRLFANETDLATYFTTQSPVADVARRLAQSFVKRYTTTLALLPGILSNRTSSNSTANLVLETGIVPFSAGSSVSHVAADLYDRTPDFLMRFEVVKGATLQSYITSAVQAAQGSANAARVASDAAIYGALGPGLRAVLAGIGYRVRGGVGSLQPIVNTAVVTTSMPVNGATATGSAVSGGAVPATTGRVTASGATATVASSWTFLGWLLFLSSMAI
ncbi:hypothetical protein BCR37DRAFT_393535 [Protomyces lactucae-debilis]|uniref:Sequence orphan n=1 Tax=Protomyces lactucae-debilis TaxID=2754530 RepID=A0A1Y2FAE7_PROLT|nr:uncharacterized protein BCR37DRAFT_393535 [Protomyces lactucae-debilis]ORY80889.1 hypothetical protein BCR37DRAFT_393535 [Protomyces lactucae-debilis]